MDNITNAPIIKCPSCKTSLAWSSDNPNRPFCSESCRNKDFIAWSEESNRIEGSSVYEDILSGDLSSDSF